MKVTMGQITCLGRAVPANAYFADVSMAGQTFEGLIDSGAAITLISKPLYDKLENVQLETPPDNFKQFGGVVPGSQLEVLGVINVPIQLGDFVSGPQCVVVVPGMQLECIIGLNFLDKYYISIDTVDRKLAIAPPGQEIVDVKLKPSFSPNCETYKVVCTDRLELKPRMVQYVPVLVQGLGEDVDGCIEGLCEDNSCFMVPRSVNSLNDCKTGIMCANVTNKSIILHPNQKLGIFTPVEIPEPRDVHSINENMSSRDALETGDISTNILQLFDLSSTDLTAQQKQLVYSLLERHSGVVGESELDLGLTHTIEHKIIIDNTGPIKQRYRRFPGPLREEIQVEVDKLLSRGIIEPSQSAWSSPLVPVRKKTGQLRLCIDYRMVNAHTRKDSYPLPHLGDAISRFKDMKYFSSLDLLSGYHQIAMEDESREVTAFSTGENLYQYRRMPFGVTNGPASFSRLMNIVLSGIPFHIAQAYLDDILVAGSTFEEHYSNLGMVFDRLAQHGLKLSAEKCALFRSEVDYLGHRVGRHGIQPLQKNVEAIVQYPRPNTVKQLRSFCGMVNFYRKFLYRAEVFMKPLYAATVGKYLNWTGECENAFIHAKKALTEAPVLQYPDFGENCQFVVTCDASGCGAGAVLTQLQGQEEKVIAYAGTSFNEAQLKYSPTDRELAAIRFAVNYFKSYLYGRKFTIRTDHQPLLYLYRMKRFDDRLHRTMEDLNIGHYELEYLPGRSNIVADALSRAPYPWKLPDDNESRVCWEVGEPGEGFEPYLISGGADSLYRALSYACHGYTTQSDDIRDAVVDKILTNPTKYGFVDSAKGRKLVELLRDPESFPPMETLQAVADTMEVELMVHFVKGPTIAYRPMPNNLSAPTINLKCSGGVHFDVLVSKLEKETTESPGNVMTVAPNSMVITDLDVPPLGLNATAEELRQAQARDEAISELIRRVRSRNRGQSVELSGPVKIFKAQFEKLSINNDNILVYQDSPNHFVPVLPESALSPLAEELHVVLSHAGRDKTIQVMMAKFYHPKFSTVITETVKNCDTCQLHKGRIDRKYPVYRRNVTEPYQVFAVDLMELPLSKKGFKCILVGIDLCTKYAYAVPLKSKKSASVARALESRVLASVPRTPKIILSDNGPEFRGKPFETLLGNYGITHEYSVPYAASTNGGVERLNQTLRSRLATVCHGNTKRWDKHLYEVVSQYNRTPHSETGRAPSEFFVKVADINVPAKPYWKPPQKFRPFVVGDLVMRKVPYQPAGEKDKLAPRYQGPLKIVVADSSGVTYQAQFMQGQRKTVQVHISQIKRFHGTWAEEAAEFPTRPAPAVQRRMRGTKAVPVEQSEDVLAELAWENLRYIPCYPGEEEEAAEEPQEWQQDIEESEDSILSGNSVLAPLEMSANTNEEGQQSFEEEGQQSFEEEGQQSFEEEDQQFFEEEDQQSFEEDQQSNEEQQSPPSILPDHIEDHLGSWEVSPTASDVVSENCIPSTSALPRTASTPQRGASAPQPGVEGSPIQGVQETRPPTLGRTRMQTRRMRGQETPGHSRRYHSPSSGSEVFYSDEDSDTELREGLSVGIGELYIERVSTIEGTGDGDLTTMDPNFEALEFHVTIDDPDKFHSLYTAKVDNYKLSVTEGSLTEE